MGGKKRVPGVCEMKPKGKSLLTRLTLFIKPHLLLGPEREAASERNAFVSKGLH